MAYQVIARKWRPQSFDEVTGQEHVTRTLRNAIEHGRLHHAYLFSGARGVGKTTTARLFAKALNCHKTTTPNPTPCRTDDPGACSSCIEIAESRSIDVLEFDAASNTQVHKIREIIIENINISPARDRYKIFIIDEVHMLSGSSFNALLKTVEEPPPNVVFIMATTELHKVPDTITSRCQEFVFRTIRAAKIAERLRLIADSESISISPEALQMIARSGEGSMRDAQSNFDQVISYALGPIDVADVSASLGLAGSEAISAIIDAISGRNALAVLNTVAELVSRGQDLRIFCRDLMATVRDILMLKVSGADGTLVDGSALPVENLTKYAENFTNADLIRYFHSLADTEIRLKDSVQPRYTLEIGLVKLIEMNRVKPIEEILKRLGETGFEGIGSSTAETVKSVTEQPASDNDAEKKNLISGPDRARTVDKPNHPATKTPAPPPDLAPGSKFTQERADFESLIRDKEFISSLPVKLPSLAADDLEHTDDKYLDAAYEHKLAISGDDLLPVKNASAIAAAVIGLAREPLAETAAGKSGTAVAMAPLTLEIPQMEETDNVPVPTLPPNPTPDQIRDYAAAHPAVRRIARLFRAKILDVRPSRENSA